MKKIISTASIIFAITFASIYPQKAKHDTLFVASWNLENLFDTTHDAGKNDVEFTPGSKKEWTQERLNKKLQNLASVIKEMNNGKGPDLLSVVEVEHKALLDSMIKKFLPGKKFKVAYKESPDKRGIDNGLIYNSAKLKIIRTVGDTVKLSEKFPTRLILNVNLLLNKKDTIRVFVNHWPSRIGGEEKSEHNRVEAAELLRRHVNYYLLKNKKSDIIILGDFNDEPGNISIKETLGADSTACTANEKKSKSVLFNLSYKVFSDGFGTYKYRDTWNMLDQIIISKDMIGGKRLKYICGSFEIFKPDMMVTKSGKYEGTPLPTYGGNRYIGGYSDHFPVTAKFAVERN